MESLPPPAGPDDTSQSLDLRPAAPTPVGLPAPGPRRRGRRWGMLLLALAALAAGLWWWLAAPPSPIEPTGELLRPRPEVTVNAPGIIIPVATVSVTPQVSGRLVALLAPDLAAVTAGQPLAMLDRAPFQKALDEAQAHLMQAQAHLAQAQAAAADALAAYRRAQTQWKNQRLAPEALDQAYATYAAALSGVQAARDQVARAGDRHQQAAADLDHTTITAPMDGILVTRRARVGQTIAADPQGPALFALAPDLSQVQIEASVPAPVLPQVQVGQAARFTLDVYPQHTFMGLVTQVPHADIPPREEPATTVTIQADNPELLLRPGLSARVIIVVDPGDAAPLRP